MNRKNRKGFTLAELLIVIALIGLLALLAYVSLNRGRVKARDAKRISDVKQMQTALELYFHNNNSYPPQQDLTTFQPDNLAPTYVSTMPTPPKPNDGSECADANPDIYPYYSAKVVPTEIDWSYDLIDGGIDTCTGTDVCEWYVLVACISSNIDYLRPGFIYLTSSELSNTRPGG